MPLRIPNNPITDGVLLQAVANVALGVPSANTQLALGSSDGTGKAQITISDEAPLLIGPWPMLLLWAGEQTYERSSRSTFIGAIMVTLEYYDRWDESARTIAQVRANIAADLERMKANLESNETLTQGAQNYALGMPHCTLSTWRGDTIAYNDVPGLTLIKRSLTCKFWLLDYDV